MQSKLQRDTVTADYIDSLFGNNEKINDFLFNRFSDGYWYISFDEDPSIWLSQKIWHRLRYITDQKILRVGKFQDVISQTEIEDIVEWSKNVLDHEQDMLVHTFNFTDIEGNRVWMKGKGFLDFNEDTGMLQGVGGFCEDISDEYEQDTMTLESNLVAKIGSWYVNLITDTVYWDEVTCSIYDFEDDYNTYNTDFKEFMDYCTYEADKERLMTAIDTLKSTGKPFDEKLPITTENGRHKWIRLIGNIKVIKGQAVKMYGLVQDITQMKSAERNRKKLAKLKSKSEELEQFAYITSHDLREPLITIQGYLDLLMEENSETLGDEAMFLLSRSSEAISRLDDLIKDLLYYSRTSKIEPLVPVCLGECLDIALKNLDAKIKYTRTKIERTELHRILGSENKLVLLFQNILSNAIKFCKEGQVPDIHVSCTDDEENHVIEITDYGIGIKEEKVKDVFMIFRRVHDNPEIQGSGIGLSICKKIMELHGGEINVKSEFGKFTTFSLSFPKQIA